MDDADTARSDGTGEDPGGPVARRMVVRGRVQGVFFRASTRRVADRHGVVGWVANRPDGSVETWLEGDPEAVDAVESWIRAGGPGSAQVREVEVEDPAPAGHERFEIVRG